MGIGKETSQKWQKNTRQMSNKKQSSDNTEDSQKEQENEDG